MCIYIYHVCVFDKILWNFINAVMIMFLKFEANQKILYHNFINVMNFTYLVF